jgi:hypothetical protein
MFLVLESRACLRSSSKLPRQFPKDSLAKIFESSLRVANILCLVGSPRGSSAAIQTITVMKRYLTVRESQRPKCHNCRIAQTGGVFRYHPTRRSRIRYSVRPHRRAFVSLNNDYLWHLQPQRHGRTHVLGSGHMKVLLTYLPRNEGHLCGRFVKNKSKKCSALPCDRETQCVVGPCVPSPEFWLLSPGYFATANQGEFTMCSTTTTAQAQRARPPNVPSRRARTA